MQGFLTRSLRSIFSSIKNLLNATRFGRNLLSDLNNRNEFTSLLSHERMLADRVRVDMYHQAISRHVKAGSVVVDLGTGTGILALFASRQNPRIVYALDHSDFIEVARKIAAHNGVTNVEFVPGNSREFLSKEKVDLIIHEQIGDELFTENMIENLLDLKKRILKADGKILPARFELFVEPAQLKAGREIPLIWERPVHGIDFSFLREDKAADPYLSHDYNCYLMDPGAFDYWLCEPQPAINVDLDMISEPDQVAHEALINKTVLRQGYLDGYVVYFRVIFDHELAFDTSPLSELTHWRSRLFRFPRRECKVGQQLSYRFYMRNPSDIKSWSLEEQV